MSADESSLLYWQHCTVQSMSSADLSKRALVCSVVAAGQGVLPDSPIISYGKVELVV